MNPINIFESWFAAEKAKSTLRLPAACCMSTIGVDGYPNARFVSLKEIINDSFVITGPLNSRKGNEFSISSKAALTFWWTETEKQVRIQGDVVRISDSEAERYFKQRNRDSQIVSSAFEQGKEIQSVEQLKAQFEKHKVLLGNEEPQKPHNWAGVYLHPIRIEFMEFKQSRLHERRLFEKLKGLWDIKIIQP